jgi:hypothetical protein
VSNVLDTATLATFSSGTTSKIVTWYDQSGGGFDQTQSTITNAPIIYQSGAVNVIHGQPAILFDGGKTYLTNATLAENPVNTLFMNAVADSNGSAVSGIVGGSAGNNLEWRVDSSTLLMGLIASATAGLGTSTLPQAASGSVLEMQYNSSTGAGSFWVDRASAGTFSSAHTFAGGGQITIGGNTFNSEFFGGSIGEVIMYDLAGGVPTGTRTSIEANQKAYWGTP